MLRCVNYRDASVAGEWRLSRAVAEAFRARLDETRGDPLEVREGRVLFVAPPHEITTILLRV